MRGVGLAGACTGIEGGLRVMTGALEGRLLRGERTSAAVITATLAMRRSSM